MPDFKAHAAPAYTLAFSPDGKTLATGGFDNLVKLWDYPALKEAKKLEGHAGNVYCLAYRKDDTLWSSSADGTIRLWNLADGKAAKEIKGHTGTVECIAFSGDGKLLASCGQDKTVRLWNPDDGKEVKNLGAHGGSVYQVAFSKDDKWLLSASQDKTIKIWDVAGQKDLRTLKGHEDAVTCAAFMPDGESVWSAGMVDRNVRLWSLKESPLAAPDAALALQVGQLFLATAGRATQPLGVSGLAPAVSIHRTPPDTTIPPKKFGPTDDDTFNLAVSPDGTFLATAGYAGWLTLWNAATGEQVSRRKLPKFGPYCVRFSPDGKTLLTGHDNGHVYLTPTEGK